MRRRIKNKAKKVILSVCLLLGLVLFVGCSDQLEGSYNVYLDEGRSELTGYPLMTVDIHGEDITMTMVSYDLVPKNFFGSSFELEEAREETRGNVDHKKKEITYLVEGEEIISPYKLEGNKLVIIMPGEDDWVLYPKGSEEYNENQELFDKQKETLLDDEGDEDEQDDTFSLNRDEERQNTTETDEIATKGPSEEEMAKTVEAIQSSFLDSLVGHWVGVHPPNIREGHSYIDILDDHTFKGSSRYDQKQDNGYNYEGSYKFTESKQIEQQLNAWLDSGDITDLAEVNTADAYVAKAKGHMKMMEMAFVVKKQVIRLGEITEDVEKEVIQKVEIVDNKLKLKSVLEIREIDYFSK